MFWIIRKVYFFAIFRQSLLSLYHALNWCGLHFSMRNMCKYKGLDSKMDERSRFFTFIFLIKKISFLRCPHAINPSIMNRFFWNLYLKLFLVSIKPRIFLNSIWKNLTIFILILSSVSLRRLHIETWWYPNELWYLIKDLFALIMIICWFMYVMYWNLCVMLKDLRIFNSN